MPCRVLRAPLTALEIMHSIPYRALYNKEPDWSGLSVIALIASVLLAFSLLLFRKASPEMVDQL